MVGQLPLVIVQTKVFIPKLNPVTPEFAEEGVVTTPVPAITDHEPVPTTGVLPASVAEVVQTVWSIPASATVGETRRLIETSSEDDAQTPFEIVQRSTFIPKLNPVTPEVGEVGVVTIPVPEITVHIPVPTIGVFAARVAFGEQTIWSGPAKVVVGGVSLKIMMSSIEDGQTPFESVQRNVFTPKLNPVTPDVGDVGVVTVPVPEITVQIPVPIIGLFPASVANVEQTV